MTVSTPSTPGVASLLLRIRQEIRWEHGAYAALIVIVLFFGFVRMRIRNIPLERDEGEYAYAGQLMLHGIPPYQLAYNMKLPGTYAAYAVIMAVFGQSESGIRIGVMLVNSASIVMVFFLTRRFQGSLAGVAAAGAFGLLSARISVLGIYGHATHFVTLAALAGVLLLLRAIDRRRMWILFAGGFCFGLAFLMKQPGVFFGIFGGLFWLWTQHGSPIRKLIFGATVFSAAAALPFAVTCLWLWRAGVFHEFWFWTFSYSRAYGSIMSIRDGLRELRNTLPWVMKPFVVWAVAFVGLTAVAWNRNVRTQAPFLVGFLIFSGMAVVPGFYFRPHYFIVLLPAVAVWTGIGVGVIAEAVVPMSRKFGETWGIPRLAWVASAAGLLLVVGIVASPNTHLSFFFQRHASAANQQLDERTGFAEAKQVAEYVRDHSSEGDQIAVVGSEPEIYFYSHRHSATAYIYTYALLERQPFAAAMQKEMLAQVENSVPEYAVYVDNESSWGWGMNPMQPGGFMDAMEQFLHSRYSLERQVPIPGGADHRWGTQSAFYVFRRKD